ncbi:serine protease 56 [Erythrolamprus reginae]|uniref:serine protease 56 n=1 Tax=Erythrolamprus reginae TaxID=121349 RepID=UPI00396C5A10
MMEPPLRRRLFLLPLLLLLPRRADPAPAAAPSGKELFPLPASVLRVFSNRGTSVLEAAMKAALLSLEEATSEHSRRLQECERCGFCHSGDCRNRSRPCTQPGSDTEDSNSVADQPVPESCGRRWVPAPNVTLPEGKIVGGSRAKPGAWPWLVSVLLNGELMCSGVLVGSAWIVTAAHCFTGSRNELAWSVVLGDYDLSKRDEGEQVVPVSRILPHPKFDPKTFYADVALLELSAPVRPSAWVNPVCLPERPTKTDQEVLCYIIGWGSLYEDGPPAEVVMEARVPILDQNLCRGALGSQLVSSTMFCAGYLSGGIDSCQGDSGGPLMCWDPSLERYILHGITSWGSGCGERGKPGVYTRITAFADWIQQQMERSPSTREPSCSEWLAVVRKPGEIRHLCTFYEQPCARSPSPAACAQAAGEKCKEKRQQCELRSCLQTLVDFLRQAEEFFRSQINFSFFTHSVPRFVEQMYGYLFPPRGHLDPQDSLVSPTHPQREKRSMRMDPMEEKENQLPSDSSCPRANESAQWVLSLRENFRWILQVPEQDLTMNFQKILVDLASKNAKGLYRAHIQAIVGRKATSFSGLVGLEQDSLYRSMPEIIALALEALKT